MPNDYLPLGIAQGVSTAGNLIAQLLTNRANRNYQNQINALNYKYYKDAQAYYSVANQAKMLQAAGFNKVLAVQGLSSGKAMSAPQMDTYRAEAPQIETQAIQGIAEMLLQKKQVESNIDLQTEQKETIKAQRLKTLAETANLEFDVELKRAQKSGNIELLNKLVEEKGQTIDKIKQEIQLMLQQFKQAQEMNPLLIEQAKQNIEKSKEEISKIIQETESEDLKQKLIEEQTKGEKLDNEFQTIINSYQERKSESEQNILDAQFKKVRAETSKIIQETKSEKVKTYMTAVQAYYEGEFIRAKLLNISVMTEAQKAKVWTDIVRLLKIN